MSNDYDNDDYNSKFGSPSMPDVPITGTNLDPYLQAGAGILVFVGGIFATKGYISDAQVTAIVGSLLSLIAVVYVAYKGRTEAKIDSLSKTLNVPKAALKRNIVAMRRK